MMSREVRQEIWAHATPVKSDFVLKERTGGMFLGSHAGLTFSYPGFTDLDFDDPVRRNTA
jgi:hypothetical protein